MLTIIAVALVITVVRVFAAQYTDNGNGTVTDKVTGLMWQQVDGGSKS
jgi:hypothetical protein